ncbi:MAG TPA: NADP-dependent malic enzyme [Bacteroidota bacterium]|nr:NADP-dependent malic enzyme [Bacteroidota bacterium]
MKIRDEEALAYHSSGRAGKIEITPTKPFSTQYDLSLAYTPGVAVPCLEIKNNPNDVYKYTAKGNLVAVVSNGTAVLGLGNIGPEAGKPVMEGKGILFKKFADIDVFDIELNAKTAEEVIRTVQALEPTFGGINLEDIKAPECFIVEEELRKTMNIPVFHDDQHGTAIISAAALLNALEIVGKKIDQVKVVFNGAGAASIACANLQMLLGVKKENLIMCDSKGVIYKGRTNDMNPYKVKFENDTTARTLAEAVAGADVFMGLSVKGAMTQEMVKCLAPDAIIFAMANPDPEITPEDVFAVRQDVIYASGRSDYANQVNNVLGFPFIFRGALDVRAKTVNEEMKVAAVRALAQLAKEDVPDAVIRAYGGAEIKFGREYIIPKPFDARVLTRVAPAVAKAAMDTGVARIAIEDWDEYRNKLEERLGRSKQFVHLLINKAQKENKRIVFPDGDEPRILRAVQMIVEQKIARPVLCGNTEKIQGMAKDLAIDLSTIEIVDVKKFPRMKEYAEELYRLRQRKGLKYAEAADMIKSRFSFGAMMVHLGEADGMIAGLNAHYPETIRPALQIIGTKSGKKHVSGMNVVIGKKDVYFMADTIVNVTPDAETLAEVAIEAAETVRSFGIEPRVAMLSFSNFGSAEYPENIKMKRAAELVHQMDPSLIVDGEMHADMAIVSGLLKKNYPFARLDQTANVLIFPNLDAAHIACKLLSHIGETDIIGPILMGMAKPVHVLNRNADVTDIINMTAICAVEAGQ